MPTATRICNELKIYTEIDMGANLFGYATLTAINIENTEEKVYFRIKMPEINNGNLNNALQDTGRTETYLRRYLYLLFLDIAQNDEVDASDNRPSASKKPSVNKPRNRPSPPSGKKQPVATNKRLTMKQKKELSDLDPILKEIIEDGSDNITMKQVLNGLQTLEDKGDLSSDERLKIAKKIATIQ